MLSVSEIFWLANLPYGVLGEFAHQVYSALADIGLRAAVPVDNWERAKREHEREQKRRAMRLLTLKASNT
jgi:hypothetical protein